MIDPYQSTIKFIIEDQSVYEKALKIRAGKYSVSNESVKACTYFRQLLKEDEGVDMIPYMSQYNADDNARKGFLTLRNINAILCWLFNKDSGFPHNIEHVKKFLANLAFDERNAEAAIVFEKFINVLYPHLPNEFRGHRYELDVTSWKFKITPKEFNPNPGSTQNKKPRLRRWLVLFAILVLSFSGYLYYRHDKPIFDKSDARYKIMILKFGQECPYQDSLEDVGYVIEKRLEELSRMDSLNLNARYVEEYIPEKELSDGSWVEAMRRVMIENNANHIIYGDTRGDNCTSSGEDELCVNHVFNNPKDELKTLEDVSPSFFPVTLTDVGEGQLQGNIDFIVYMQAYHGARWNKPERALSYLTSIISSKNTSHKNKLFAQTERIVVLSDSRKYEEVKTEALSLLENDSTNVLPAHKRIFAKLMLNDLNILGDAEQMIKENPSHWRGYYTRAFYYGLNGEYRPDDITKALEYAKNKEDRYQIYYTFGEWLGHNGYFNESISFLDNALKINENPEALHRRGKNHHLLGYPLKAIDDVKRAISLRPNEEYYHLTLGEIYSSIDKIKEADECFKNAVEIAPEIGVYVSVIVGWLGYEHYPNAKQYIEQGLARFPSDSLAQYSFRVTRMAFYETQNKRNHREYISDSVFVFNSPPKFAEELSRIGFSFDFHFNLP